ncbi:PIG-L deacetylase family protein [Anaerocolumna sp.]|uniref:PIG-L deacetylase family protein n=1 Tax=Anaerocolumna sp. TaxID=2041569 RepID=UPI0028A77442|nr:PIG-L deacetylase family protein [Anaerocolumna sp.]
MNILVIAPHADDEILGVGGTIAKYIHEGHNVFVCITSRGYKPLFSEELVETVLREAKECHKLLGIKETFYFDFPASMLEKVNRSEINDKLYEVIYKVQPDIVFIPHYGDMQKDHEIIAEASMVALRPKYKHRVKTIYSYETVSETECNIPHTANVFIPNVYIDISNYLQKKMEAMKQYQSQLYDFPNSRSIEALDALAKYRGATINVRAAEAFALIRQVI